jgi:multidrug efflux system outer membrane protein
MNTPHLFRSVRMPAAALTLSLTAAGCTVGPNYERPKLEPPVQHRSATAQAAAESVADVPWWQIYNDPALQGLVRDGIANNLDLRAASARVVESRALAGVAKSYLYPDIGAGFGWDGNQPSRVGDPKVSKEAVPDRTYSNWALTGSLSWEIDLFGKLRRNKEAAFAQYLASEEGRRAVLITLVSDIASTYFYLRELDLQLEIAKTTVKLNDETVSYYTKRLQGGVSNRLEVDQAKANRAVTGAAIPDIERQIAIAENALSVLLGRAPGPIARGAVMSARDVPPVIPAGLPAQLLERRPDVVQAEQLLVAANANIGVAKALFYPAISLTGAFGTVSSSLSDFLSVDSLVWSLGAGLFQPIFNAGRIRQNYDAAVARYDLALAQYQKAALNGYREVADSLVTIQKLAERRTEIETGVEALRDAQQLSRARYDTGLSSYLEVLIADQQLFSQEIQLAQVRGAQYRAVAQLYRALGGGWQPEQPAAPPTGQVK